MKKIVLACIMISAVLMFYNVSFASTPEVAQTIKPAPTIEPTSKGAGQDGLNIDPLGVGGMVSNIKTFFEDGVGGVVEKSLGDICESFVNVTAIDGKWVFSTPTLIEAEWVRKLWWIMLFVSVGCIGIGIGVTMIRIMAGKYRGELKTALLSFIASAALLMFSLMITDKLILFGNDLMNSYARSTLTSEAKKPENKSAMILTDDINYKKIGFEYFDGKSLVKLSFGSNLSTQDQMYEQFLTKNGGGGGIILVWAMLVIALIGVFGILRQLIICIINGLGPIWISIAAWTGNMKPVFGYVNLNIRCIALSFVFDFTWLICIYVSNHSGDFAVGRQLFATIMYTIALIVSCYLFGYWVYQAIRSPIDLAGGLVEEYAIKRFESTYPGVGILMERLGIGSERNEAKNEEDAEFFKKDENGIGDRLSVAEKGNVKPVGNEVRDNTENRNIGFDKTIQRPVKSNVVDLNNYKQKERNAELPKKDSNNKAGISQVRDTLKQAEKPTKKSIKGGEKI